MEGTLDNSEMLRQERKFSSVQDRLPAERRYIYNRSFLIDPSGEEILSYSKCHLFDVDFRGLKVGNAVYPGDRVVANEPGVHWDSDLL